MGIKSATSLTRSGVSDWIIQRLSAVILAIYSIYLVGFLAFGPGGYDAWVELFSCPIMKVATILALLALGAHVWVGLWTISTDYLNERQMGRAGTISRWVFQGVSALVLFGSITWAFLVLLGAK